MVAIISPKFDLMLVIILELCGHGREPFVTGTQIVYE
ncbi:MAG: hypothetical protein CM1200mP15_03080 [Dehalococcoidia bacterium]|nr:MAG: hypothetical protein CM1200mP15_03080 [Dehalococcoidia bacterium]